MPEGGDSSFLLFLFHVLLSSCGQPSRGLPIRSSVLDLLLQSYTVVSSEHSPKL